MADVTLNIRHNADQATGSVNSLSNAMGRMAANSRSASTAGNAAANGFNKIGLACLNAGRSASHGATGISKFVSSLGRIAYYRAIRTAIKYVGKAFSDGLQAAYAFSKANQPADYAKLAGAMDGIKKAASTMSLQLGAAFGGLITAIAPVLIKIINLVTQAADAITRFFAVLNGSGYYKHAAEGFDDVGDSAGGAGKKIKGLLASWDELNVIGKETGGGGGGSNTPDYSGAYEWVEPESDWANLIMNGEFFKLGEQIADKINNGIRNLDANKIAKTVSNAIKDALDLVLGLLEETDWATLGTKIGEFIAGLDWSGITSKVSEALGAVLGAIGALVYNAIAEIFGGNDDTSETTVVGKIQSAFDWIIDNVLKPFGEGFLKAAGLENALYNWELFCDKLKAAIGIAAEYINAVFAALKPVADDYVPYWEVLFTRIEKEFKEFARDALQVVQDSWVLRKLFGDQSQLLFTLDCDIAAAEEKLTKWEQQVDAASEGLINIDANIDHEKVDGYLETLNTPFKTTVEPEVEDPVTMDDVFPNRPQGHNKKVGEGAALPIFPEVDEGSYTTVVDELNEVIGEKTATLNTVFDEGGEKVLQTVVQELSDYDKIDATADLGFDVPTEDQKRLQDAWNSVSAYGKASGTASLGYGYAAGALNTLNGAKKSLDEYGKISANATIGINGDKAVTEALPTIKEAFNAVKDKNGKLTITQDKKNPKPKELDKMATAYDRFKDDSTKKGTVSLTSGGDLLKTVGETLLLAAITNLWSNLKAGTKKLKVELDVDKTAADFVAGWNKLSDKTVRFSISVDEEMKSKWNYLGKKWNNSPLASAYGRLPLFAQGGFPEKGQLFIANEAGPELVSTMGGQTAVANNDQIISGIQRGTEQANEEQNELLRGIYAGVMKMMQNGLTVSPSVGLGQVVARSNALYGRA